MKNTFLFLLLFAFCTACQPAAEPDTMDAPITVDAEQIEKEVAVFMDGYVKAFKGLDAEAMRPMISDRALICGTDPKEIWNKEQILEQTKKMSEIEGLDLNYTIDVQKIHVAEDGQSAIVLQQAIISFVSPSVPLRMTTQVVKSNDTWKIDYSNLGLIPLNEDLAKINAAYEN